MHSLKEFDPYLKPKSSTRRNLFSYIAESLMNNITEVNQKKPVKIPEVNYQVESLPTERSQKHRSLLNLKQSTTRIPSTKPTIPSVTESLTIEIGSHSNSAVKSKKKGHIKSALKPNSAKKTDVTDLHSELSQLSIESIPLSVSQNAPLCVQSFKKRPKSQVRIPITKNYDYFLAKKEEELIYNSLFGNQSPGPGYYSPSCDFGNIYNKFSKVESFGTFEKRFANRLQSASPGPCEYFDNRYSLPEQRIKKLKFSSRRYENSRLKEILEERKEEEENLGPGRYNVRYMDGYRNKNYSDFGVKSRRFKTLNPEDISVGPGAYNILGENIKPKIKNQRVLREGSVVNYYKEPSSPSVWDYSPEISKSLAYSVYRKLPIKLKPKKLRKEDELKFERIKRILLERKNESRNLGPGLYYENHLS